MTHSRLRSERIRILGGGISGRPGGGVVLVAQHNKEPKSLLPDTIYGLKMYQNSRGSALNPAEGALRALQGPLAGFGGPLCGREGRGTAWKEKGK